MLKSKLLSNKSAFGFDEDLEVIKKGDKELKEKTEREDNIEHFDINDLEVKPSKTAKTDLPQTQFMKEGIIAKFPSMLLNVGRSGSGKSTVVCYLFRNANFIGKFFDDVYLFSNTASVDDLTKILKIPKKNQFDRPKEEDLANIIEKQKKLIETKGIKEVAKKNKVLIIFDDILSSVKFLKSDAMLKLATMGRHYLISSIICTQSYTKIPRAIRLQANSMILFPSNMNEVNRVCEDIAPPNCKKRDFLRLIQHATEGKHDFLYCNYFEPAERRFRKGFGTILNVVNR
jgi:hypothetical protein